MWFSQFGRCSFQGPTKSPLHMTGMCLPLAQTRLGSYSSTPACLPNSSSLPASPHPTHPLLPDTAPRGSGWGVPASACLAESQGNSWLCTTPRQATVDRTGTPRSELTSSCHLPQCDQVVNCVHTNLCHWNGSPRWLTLMNLLIFCSDM